MNTDRSDERPPFFLLHETPDYWTVTFTPKGTWMGRWNKSEAEEYAKTRNTLFSTAEARMSKFVGRKIGIYDASANLIATREILAVNENVHDIYPQRYIAGTHVALLDDGTEIVGPKELLERETGATIPHYPKTGNFLLQSKKCDIEPGLQVPGLSCEEQRAIYFEIEEDAWETGGTRKEADRIVKDEKWLRNEVLDIAMKREFTPTQKDQLWAFAKKYFIES